MCKFIFIASSSVGQKTKHFVPKKKREQSKDKPKIAKRVVSKGRNSSSTKINKPPLKPNLKSTKSVSKNEKSQLKGTQEQKRGSINTNPFKPPKPTSKIEPKEEIKIQKNKNQEETKEKLK